MKRSPLRRHGGLRRSRPRTLTPDEAAAKALWKEPRAGWCQCGRCDRFALHLEHHHVVTLSRIRQEGRDDLAWDPRNGMYLHKVCHSQHTDAFQRIPFASVPDSALDFAVDLLGEGGAAAYFARAYAGDERRAA